MFPFFRAKAYYDDPELRRRRRGQSVSSGDVGHGTPAEATPSSSRPKPTFPPASSDTWTADVESFPSVTVGVLFKFLCLREVLLTNNGTSQLTQKPLHRGYQFYFWSYVHNIRVCQLPEKEHGMRVHLLMSNCWASQRKHTKYVQELKLVEVVDDVGVRLDYTSCSCPAGIGGGCQHIAALFFTLEKCRLTHAERFPGPESSTSLERAWGPRQRDITPKPLSEVVIERPRSFALCADGEPEAKRSCIQSTLYDARGDPTKNASRERVTSLVSELRAAPGNKCVLLTILDPEASDILTKSKLGDVPSGSCLSYQQCPVPSDERSYADDDARLPEAAAAVTEGEASRLEALPSSLPSTQAECVSVDVGFVQLPLFESRAVNDGPPTRPLSCDVVWRIEQSTRDQAQSKNWFSHRSHRLTASQFHSVVMRKKEVTPAFLGRLFSDGSCFSSQVSVPPLEHGRLHEDDAAAEYVSSMHAHGKASLKIFKCGLCVHPLHSFLGASPDRIVFDPSMNPPHGLLEVKCPLCLFDADLTPHDACMELADFCCSLQDGKVCLKTNHPYYFQIQGQMAVCGLTWCDFLVWAGSSRISVERVFFDEDFWQTIMLPCLIDFFQNHASPYLIKLPSTSLE